MALLPIRSRRRGESVGPWNEIDRLYESFLGNPLVHVHEEVWHPRVDVYDRSNEVVIQVELPGLERKDIDISVEEDHLVIQGSRERPKAYKEEEGWYGERQFGAYHRVIHLPASVDSGKAKAATENGILTITLAKAERAKARKIEVK